MAVGSSNDFDLIVLGAGTGGYTAAFRGAQLGLRVALVDEGLLGGTCLHRGCIPTKAMLESAALNERLRHAADYGLKLPGAAEIDFPQIAKRRDQIVDPHVEGRHEPGQEERRDLDRRPRPPRRRPQGPGQARGRGRDARAPAASGSSTAPT